MIREASEKVAIIKEMMKEAHDRHKSYADRQRKDLEFAVGDVVFVKVSPMNGFVRFRKPGKLASRFSGPLIVKRIGSLACRVELSERLLEVHNVFDVSHLTKHVHDSSLILETYVQEDLDIEPNLVVVRHPVYIVDLDERRLRNNVVKLVKVQWSDVPRDGTWETDYHIRETLM